MRQISSDPFARVTLYRENIPANPEVSKGCAWCGGFKVSRHGKPFLYVYTVSGDGSRSRFESKPACSKGCAESWHGGPLI